jgi:hypothetical protein
MNESILLEALKFILKDDYNLSLTEIKHVCSEAIKKWEDSSGKQEAEKQGFIGVYGVDINWNIQWDKSDLGNVMKSQDCRFIGSEKECIKFIEKYKPKSEDSSGKETGWIDINKQLPYGGQKVDLWLVPAGDEEKSHRISWTWEKQDTAKIGIGNAKVTHWMPTPQPPDKSVPPYKEEVDKETKNKNL